MKTVQYGPLSIVLGTLAMSPTSKYSGMRRIFRLTQPYLIVIREQPENTVHLQIPAGYETDLASIPIILQPIMGTSSRYAEAAVVHDWLCDHDWPPFLANAIMRCMLEVLGHSTWRRVSIFWAIQLFGYGSWPRQLYHRFKGRKGHAHY